MYMPENERPPGTDVIDVPISIDVLQVGASAAFHHDRLAAHGAERARGAIYAAGHQPQRSLEDIMTSWAIHCLEFIFCGRSGIRLAEKPFVYGMNWSPQRKQGRTRRPCQSIYF
jgi:hypothetical protein